MKFNVMLIFLKRLILRTFIAFYRRTLKSQQHGQIQIHSLAILFSIACIKNCVEKTKLKKKRPVMADFF